MTISLFDLTEVAKHYEPRDRHKAFRKLVRDFANASAAEGDIRMASRMIAAVRSAALKWEQIPDNFLRAGTSAALGMAIVLYARATKLRSGARGAVDLALSLPEALLDDHNIIHGLRDDAIAHLGPGKREGDDVWWRAAVVFRFVDGFPDAIGLETFFVGFDEGIADRLERLLFAAEPLLRSIGQELSSRLSEELVRISTSNLSFKKRVESTLFDVKRFHEGHPAGSAENADPAYGLSVSLSPRARRQLYNRAG